jgi:hypothetical protein
MVMVHLRYLVLLTPGVRVAFEPQVVHEGFSSFRKVSSSSSFCCPSLMFSPHFPLRASQEAEAGVGVMVGVLPRHACKSEEAAGLPTAN